MLHTILNLAKTACDEIPNPGAFSLASTTADVSIFVSFHALVNELGGEIPGLHVSVALYWDGNPWRKSKSFLSGRRIFII